VTALSLMTVTASVEALRSWEALQESASRCNSQRFDHYQGSRATRDRPPRRTAMRLPSTLSLFLLESRPNLPFVLWKFEKAAVLVLGRITALAFLLVGKTIATQRAFTLGPKRSVEVLYQLLLPSSNGTIDPEPQEHSVVACLIIVPAPSVWAKMSKAPEIDVFVELEVEVVEMLAERHYNVAEADEGWKVCFFASYLHVSSWGAVIEEDRLDVLEVVGYVVELAQRTLSTAQEEDGLSVQHCNRFFVYDFAGT